MKRAVFFLMIGMIAACNKFEDGIIIDPPDIPTVTICDFVATDAEVEVMADKIESEAFKDERMDRAKYVTKDYCFITDQVIEIMRAFSFEDARLEIAKHLYHQTTDRQNYDLVVDELTFKSDRDELREYIMEH